MIEFAEYGFKLASTNRIVQAAGIGKGMLFYYFKNKLELYNFLVEYAFACLHDDVAQMEALSDSDMIERYRKLNKIKMTGYIKHRSVYEFISRMYLNEDEAALSEESKRCFSMLTQKHAEVIEKIYFTADVSLFRSDIPSDKIIRYVRWAMDGYTQDILRRVRGKKTSEIDFAPYVEEYETYLSDLKKVFYKN